MYQTSDIRKNLKVKMDGAPWVVVEFQFVKPGKGSAFTRTKFKNMITGQVVEKNIRSGETLEEVDIESRKAQMLYPDADGFVFMDAETFEQFNVSRETLGERAGFLTEGMTCDVLFYEGRVISADLPNFVELEITYTEPAVKGDTATNTTKTAKLSTGAEIQVPLFVSTGEVIKIDTRTSEYAGRVK